MQNIKIKCVPFSDWIIEYKNKLTLEVGNTLTIEVVESIEHVDKVAGITNKSNYKKLTTLFYSHKGKKITGKYLRVTVIDKKIGWALINKLPKLYRPKNLNEPAAFSEIKN